MFHLFHTQCMIGVIGEAQPIHKRHPCIVFQKRSHFFGIGTMALHTYFEGFDAIV